MNTVIHKLRSRNGASMILAMVFMLFCLFVGGSVLAAAAENGYRVEHLSDQQQYLNERSAALLIRDQLNPEGSDPLRLTIYEIKNTIQPVYVQDGGVVVEVPETSATVEEYVIIQAPVINNMTPMQRIILEAAVWQYMKESGMSQADAHEVELYNFPADVTDVDNFWYQYNLDNPEAATPVSGTITVSGDTRIAGFDATFTCGTDHDPYDFSVDFGSLTQMNVLLDGYSGRKAAVTTTNITSVGSNQFARITSESRQLAISWEEPVIEKGGA
ncbi:MAG: hypothetical protein ACI3V0_11705 [Faecousia sp.]